MLYIYEQRPNEIVDQTLILGTESSSASHSPAYVAVSFIEHLLLRNKRDNSHADLDNTEDRSAALFLFFLYFWVVAQLI